MKYKAGIVAAVVLLAIAAGMALALLVSENSAEKSVESRGKGAAASPSWEAGRLLTDAPTPTPILATVPPNPSTPPPFTAEGPPAEWLDGKYRVLFTMTADSCGEHIPPQEHDLLVGRSGPNVRIEDTFTGWILEGPGGADGSFRVEVSTPLVPGSQRMSRQVMVGKAESGRISGDYFAYPAIRDCAVQMRFEGSKIS